MKQPCLHMLAYYHLVTAQGPLNLFLAALLLILLVTLVYYILLWLEWPPKICKLIAAIIGLASLIGFLSGCSTMTPATKSALLGDVYNTAYQGAMATGAAVLSGQNGQDAAEAAFIAAGEQNGLNALGTLITAYAGPKAAPIADAALNAIQNTGVQNVASRTVILNTVGAAIQAAANENFAK